MEKKKVLETIKSKIKDTPLLSTVFLKEKDNTSSAALFELHDRCIVSYNVTQYQFRPPNPQIPKRRYLLILISFSRWSEGQMRMKSKRGVDTLLH